MTLAESYFPADRSVPLLDVSIGQLLIDAAADSPDTTALVDGVAAADQRRRWTYPQLLRAARGVAHELLARFESGERVAIWGPSMPE